MVRCDATAEFPPGFLDCLVASFAGEGSSARQPVVTLQGGAASPKLALAMHRHDAQLVISAGRSDMPLEDVARLLVESGAQHLRLDAGGPAAAAPALDWRDIPASSSTATATRRWVRLVDWLRAGGTRRIVILDNASTYPPLLQYYDALPEGVKCRACRRTTVPTCWQQRVHEVLDTPYVLTDSDIVPADFARPTSWSGSTRRCSATRREQGRSALRIDNLPDGYADADTVRKWESQFWGAPWWRRRIRRAHRHHLRALPGQAGFSIDDRALRLGRPYVVEHTPWYAIEDQLSAEEQYYREHASKTFSNWSVRGKQSSTYLSERVQRFDQRARVLNIDAADERIPGWLNFGHEVQIDERGRLPLANGASDGVRLNDALQGLPEIAPLFAELRRITRVGAKLQLRVALERGEDWQRTPWGQQLAGAVAPAGNRRLRSDHRPRDERLCQQGLHAHAGRAGGWW